MSSLNLASTNNDRSYRSDKEELWRCLTLYRALLRGDQRGFEQIARSLCPHIPLIEAMYVSMSRKITGAGDTGLHVLVGAGKWFDDLMNRPRMIISVLTLRNRDGHTPLCVAAMVGNMKAAKILLQLDMELPPNVRAGIDAVGPYPIIEAVRYGHKEMVLLLIGDYVAKKLEDSPPTKQSTTSLFLHLLVVAGFYDLLLALVRYHPVLARTQFYGGDDESLLSLMAEKPSAFWSGTQLGFWHRLLYSVIPAKLESRLAEIGKSLVNQQSMELVQPHNELTWECSMKCPRDRVIAILVWLSRMINSCINRVAPVFKHIKDTKLMHEETLDTVKCLCKELMKEYNIENINAVLRKALLLAASSGISEIIEEILDCYPDAIWFVNSENHNLFHLAVKNRHENVFNLIYQLSLYKHLVIADEDTKGNNILHLAGKLAPPGRLNLISGAALQMQREIQWFQVELARGCSMYSPHHIAFCD